MDTVLVAVIISLWLLLFLPMALVMLLPTPHDWAEDGAKQMVTMRQPAVQGPAPGHRSAA